MVEGSHFEEWSLRQCEVKSGAAFGRAKEKSTANQYSPSGEGPSWRKAGLTNVYTYEAPKGLTTRNKTEKISSLSGYF